LLHRRVPGIDLAIHGLTRVTTPYGGHQVWP
jgi:hypothetical protein